LQVGEVPPPDAPKDRLGDGPTNAASRPEWEAKSLVPGEERGAPSPTESETATPCDQTGVADPHRPAGLPFGDLHAVQQPGRADLGVALERGPHAPGAAARQADVHGVVHPTHVRPHVLDRAPDIRR